MLSKVNISRIVFLMTLGLIGLLVLSWFVTTPAQIGPFGITIWFICLYFALSGVIALVVYRFDKNLHGKPDTFSKALGRGLLIGLWLTALIGLNSLRQLGLKDVILISLLVVLIEFYMRRK